MTPYTLYVFDIDGTLFNSGGNIRVVHPEKPTYKLTSSEYNTHKLSSGEQYDYVEFRDGKIFKETAQPVIAVLNQAKQIVSNQHETSKTILLTARSNFIQNEPDFKEAFKNHGFPLDHIEVEYAGRMNRYNSNTKPHISKAVILKKYLASGRYNRVEIWDDSKPNLDTMIKLGHYYPTLSITGYYVSPEGAVSKYNTTLKEDYHIPKESLNISRGLMPQVGSDFPGFLKHLESHGVHHEVQHVLPSDLKATQSEFSQDIINNIVKHGKSGPNPPVISHDNYIIDGHHRWLANLNSHPTKKMKVIKLHKGILDCLQLARSLSLIHISEPTR